MGDISSSNMLPTRQAVLPVRSLRAGVRSVQLEDVAGRAADGVSVRSPQPSITITLNC